MFKKYLLCTMLLLLIVFGASCNKNTEVSLTPETDTNPSPESKESALPSPATETENTPEESPAPVLYPVETESPVNTPLSAPEQGEVALVRIAMFENNRGWAVGNGDYHILRTYDGGQIWEDVSPVDLTFEGDTNKPSMYYHFLDAETGWVALSRLDSTFLFHTIDSGESWEQSALQFSVSDLFFADQQNGFILTDLGAAAGSHYVAIYASADAGKTWDLQFTHEPGASLSLPEGGSKSGFTFLDAQNGWVTGSAPIENSIYLYRTSNRAQNWEQAFCIPPDSVSGGFFESRPPKFIDNLVGFLPLRALTPAGESRGLFCVTEDGGEKWTATAVLSVFEEFDFVDGQHGWVAGPEGLFRTTDGGNSWVDLTSSAPSDMFMMQIDFIDPQTGWLLVSTDPAMKEGVRLLKTVDGGVTWNLVITRLVDDSN